MNGMGGGRQAMGAREEGVLSQEVLNVLHMQEEVQASRQVVVRNEDI